jgi:hypothetical protein
MVSIIPVDEIRMSNVRRRIVCLFDSCQGPRPFFHAPYPAGAA